MAPDRKQNPVPDLADDLTIDMITDPTIDMVTGLTPDLVTDLVIIHAHVRFRGSTGDASRNADPAPLDPLS
jgi:hypothetical protein